MLADHVYEELLVALMDGTKEAGTPLSIEATARQLNVSPTPVREALARLESTGMIRRSALRGYRVAPLFTPDEIAELMDARLVIEPVNARLACSRGGAALCEELRRAIGKLKTSPRGPSFADFRSYWEADERFHRLIAEHAGNQFLLSAYNALGGQVQRFRLFGGLGVTDADFSIAEHTTIVEAFEAGDAERARDAMISHIRQVKERARHDSEIRT